MSPSKGIQPFTVQRDPTFLFDPYQSIVWATFCCACVFLVFEIFIGRSLHYAIGGGIIFFVGLPSILCQLRSTMLRDNSFRTYTVGRPDYGRASMVARPSQYRFITRMSQSLSSGDAVFRTGLRRNYRNAALAVCLLAMTVFRFIPGFTAQTIVAIILTMTIYYILQSALSRCEYVFSKGCLMIRTHSHSTREGTFAIPIRNAKIHADLESGLLFIAWEDCSVCVDMVELHRPYRFLSRFMREIESA